MIPPELNTVYDQIKLSDCYSSLEKNMKMNDIQVMNTARSMDVKNVDCQEPSASLRQPSYIEPNLRRLRAHLTVSECGSVQRAAEKLHLTRSSLTRAVQELERQLGLVLFERTRLGMLPTEFGVILTERVRRALAHLDAAEKELLAAHGDDKTVKHSGGFSNKVTHRQLAALIGIADYQTETSAAQQLALSQPAVTQALRDLERLVGESLFVRTTRGMVATTFGEILLRRAKLAFSEITAASNDIAARVGLIMGHVVVGTLPLAGTLLIPRAINLLLREHPNLQVVVVEGTYQSLINGLLCGDLDMIVGGLNHPTLSEVVQDHLFQDVLAVVVRKGHALATKKNLSLTDLTGVDWVVPRKGTPARGCFDGLIMTSGLELGANPIESDALLTVRALLMESDRVALISRRQIRIEESAGLLTVLPIKINLAVLPVGIHMRADALPSVGVQTLVRHLHMVNAEM
jgi:LysR family transcriptional regulator of gallate degradation